MRRRNFIMLLGGAAAWSFAARAQQPALPVVGYLSVGPPSVSSVNVGALQQGLSEAGFVEGRNVAMEFRWAGDRYERLPELAADLVRRQVSVIVSPGVPATAAAKAATSTIPIVFTMGADPVALGLIASLSRPGANLTGIATLGIELGSKHLELLHELAPAASIMGLLVNPNNPSGRALTTELPAAAHKLGLDLHILQARTEDDLDRVVGSLRQLGGGGLVISNEALFFRKSARLAALTVGSGMPAVHVDPAFVAAGGLMSYGPNRADSVRQVGLYAGRILNGAKPSDLPVQQPTRYELTINVKTAKALGLTVPQTLLVAADEVIE
ncbi:MAG TPA: ABC transporter substrate-binding protein [Gemmataceae bacterium]|jgi:putative ABC transport system substrate-binding protein|nr:ABC transporter substrate-binding protein [Gemmataceae bacterium]